jgi:mRNA-degrading endonuclease toxin of MazEF toxin-antitoxin module
MVEVMDRNGHAQISLLVVPEGCKVIGVVLADQLKSLDWRARVTSRILPLLGPDNAATL